MPREDLGRIVQELTRRGFNAEREAVTLIAADEDPDALLEAIIESLPDASLTIRAEHVRARRGSPGSGGTASSISAGDETPDNHGTTGQVPPETNGSTTSAAAAVEPPQSPASAHHPSTRTIGVENDVTGRSTGTGSYEDFVATFRDRFERLAGLLRSRVTHRPTTAVGEMSGGSEAALIGMVSDIRTTANGHWLIELEDTAGTFPTLVSAGSEVAPVVEELLLDEVIAVEGRLADDAGILFVDTIHFPDVPRTHRPSTADRHVQAALISDVHVGSQEFLDDAWDRFADWLDTPEADPVEYLLIAGDMVEGVGVYPGQDEELDIIDLYEQYETFASHLEAVPSDLEILLIPGNHDAVRLAEPQPGFDEELRDLMAVHDATIVGNPAIVTIEGVSILMYHGVSLDEVIAELPSASYDEPHLAMAQLLRKRHLAPQYGERTRLAPEARDYLVIDEVPDVFHAGHVHKLGVGRYNNVTTVNSGCWQAQTSFQKRVNIEPDAGYAPILDLDTLDVTLRKFT